MKSIVVAVLILLVLPSSALATFGQKGQKSRKSGVVNSVKQLGYRLFSVTSVKATKIGNTRFVTKTSNPLFGTAETTYFKADGRKYLVEKTKSIVSNAAKVGVGAGVLLLIGAGLVEATLPANFMGS